MSDSDVIDWNAVAADIERYVDKSYPRFIRLSDDLVTARPSVGDWSIKEIIGHLIDSASNKFPA